MPVILKSHSEAVTEVWSRLGDHVRIATPLGLGKPNIFLNELYERAKADPKKSLKIYTALSLRVPNPGQNELAKRFLGPFAKRHWGANYPDLSYAKDAEANRLPANVTVHEFYFRAGAALRSQQLQTSYQSINYTHVAEAVYNDKIQLIVQLVARDPNGSGKLSLGCNPDVTLDLVDLYKKGELPVLKVAVIHPDLPYTGGDAEVDSDFFDIIVDEPAKSHELFALPRMPISEADHAIGFYASQLIADEGTLQIGIGSLSDAVVSSLLVRHEKPQLYKSLFNLFWSKNEKPERLALHVEPFAKGLYGLSEMVTDAYMHLHRAGILKREVRDEHGSQSTYLHGAFYLGSKDFYQWIRGLKGAEFHGLRMTRVSKVNDLYDPNELHLRRQRINARFLNTCMQVTYLGGAASETLDNAQVVSGVGGQYNFVSMSHELKGSRSILMLRSTRESGGVRKSNIVPAHGHLTIPRHLRDIVITEYGIADLRSRSDAECIQALIEISDAEFQEELLETARSEGKIPKSYRIPEWARKNTPNALKARIREGQKDGAFQPFALGSDFTPQEQRIALALEKLKARSEKPGVAGKLDLLRFLTASFSVDQSRFSSELTRMGLERPQSLKEKLYAQLLVAALNES